MYDNTYSVVCLKVRKHQCTNLRELKRIDSFDNLISVNTKSVTCGIYKLHIILILNVELVFGV